MCQEHYDLVFVQDQEGSGLLHRRRNLVTAWCRLWVHDLWLCFLAWLMAVAHRVQSSAWRWWTILNHVPGLWLICEICMCSGRKQTFLWIRRLYVRALSAVCVCLQNTRTRHLIKKIMSVLQKRLMCCCCSGVLNIKATSCCHLTFCSAYAAGLLLVCYMSAVHNCITELLEGAGS